MWNILIKYTIFVTYEMVMEVKEEISLEYLVREHVNIFLSSGFLFNNLYN